MKKEAPRGFVFYSQDYFGDVLVRLMPPELRLVWIEAFLLMDQSPRRGVLLKKNGEPYANSELATLMNSSIENVEKAIAWVLREGIASLDRKTKALMNRRMFREDFRRKINEKNGKKGGNPQLLVKTKVTHLHDSVNRKDNQPLKSRARVPDPDPDPDPILINSSLTLHSPTAEKRGSVYSADFEIFWSAYPKKTGKGAAFESWKKNGHPHVSRIVEILAVAKQSLKWLEESGRYIPNPSTWLNQKRWDDDYAPARPERKYQG